MSWGASPLWREQAPLSISQKRFEGRALLSRLIFSPSNHNAFVLLGLELEAFLQRWFWECHTATVILKEIEAKQQLRRLTGTAGRQWVPYCILTYPVLPISSLRQVPVHSPLDAHPGIPGPELIFRFTFHSILVRSIRLPCKESPPVRKVGLGYRSCGEPLCRRPWRHSTTHFCAQMLARARTW